MGQVSVTFGDLVSVLYDTFSEELGDDELAASAAARAVSRVLSDAVGRAPAGWAGVTARRRGGWRERPRAEQGPAAG